MPALQGVGVLVTRPEQQAMPLCRLLQAQGASTCRLPAIEIRAIGNRRETAAQLGPLESFDAIIFTSANAVRFGASLLDQKRELTLAAVGPATARALNQAGYRVSIQPDSSGSYDSEGLLLHSRLEYLAGRRVLLIKGRNGRGLLEEELARRGARVTTAEVYERLPASPSAALLAEVSDRFVAGGLQVITATSVEIAASLLQIAPPALRAEFERAHWLVPGERIAAALREHSLSAPLVRADSADDHDLVAALVRWRAAESGA